MAICQCAHVVGESPTLHMASNVFDSEFECMRSDCSRRISADDREASPWTAPCAAKDAKSWMNPQPIPHPAVPADNPIAPARQHRRQQRPTGRDRHAELFRAFLKRTERGCRRTGHRLSFNRAL